MNKKGFTLIEMISVLVIISLIALVSVVSVTKILESSKKTLSNSQIKQIESATRIWGADNMTILPNDPSSENVCEYKDINSCPEYYKELTITLKDLQDGGYLPNNIKDAVTNEEIDQTIPIKITKKGNNIEYEVIIVDDEE